MKKKIEKWYKQGLWTADMVHDAVGKVFFGEEFTEADYAAIIGGA